MSKMKRNVIIIALVILALLNFQIVVENEMINSRILTVLIKNLSWYFLSFLLLIVFQVLGFYKMLFGDEKNQMSSKKMNSYKIIGLKILGGLFEFFSMTLLIIGVIAYNFYLMNENFLEHSINFLKLSGFNLSREIPLTLLILFVAYGLLLETIYLSMVIIKAVFYRNNRILLSFISFLILSFVNSIVLINIIEDIVPFNLINTRISFIKIFMLMSLCYLLASFFLEESDFSQ